LREEKVVSDIDCYFLRQRVLYFIRETNKKHTTDHRHCTIPRNISAYTYRQLPAKACYSNLRQVAPAAAVMALFRRGDLLRRTTHSES
jgi:hypothetical protein